MIFRISPLLLMPMMMTLGAIGCAPAGDGGGEPGKATTVVTPESHNTYTRASCQFRFDEGDEVRESLFGTRDHRVTLFGKSIDLAPLRAVLQASGSATVAWIGRFGAQVYGMPGKLSLACPFFAHLPAPPEDFGAYWSEATKGNTSTQFVAGLYAGARHPKVPTTTAGGDGVLGVRQDASRWTLVHEFGHHLFQVRKNELGEAPDEEVQAKLLRALMLFDDAQKAYARSPTLVTRRDQARRLVELAPLLQSMFTRFHLEEVSIEVLLRQAYSAGRTSYLADELDSGRGYILQSAVSAYKMLQEVQKEALDERIDLRVSAPSLVDELAALTALDHSVEALMSEIRTVVLALPGTPPLPGGGLSAMLALDPRPTPRAEPTCAHGLAMDALLRQAGAVFARP